MKHMRGPLSLAAALLLVACALPLLLLGPEAYAKGPAKPVGVDRVSVVAERPRDADVSSRAEEIRRELLNADGGKVLVVAHRGDWRNAPENSLQAIQNCIEMGVEIVEIDVRMTKDRRLVLMHDETLDRTSTGSGNVWDFDLDELRRLRLKNGQGIPTSHLIPTLEEAMELARGRIMVNLDKCYGVFKETHAVLSATGTLDHAIVKGWQLSPYQFEQSHGSSSKNVLFMPIIDLDSAGATDLLEACRRGKPPVAYEFIFEKEPDGIARMSRELRREGSRVWLNALWPFFNAGHDDDRAVNDADGSYGWLIAAGANIIQTDRPRVLIQYLRSDP